MKRDRAYGGVSFIGKCSGPGCGKSLALALPDALYSLERFPLEIGCCPHCGRRYELDLGVVRGVEDVVHYAPRDE